MTIGTSTGGSARSRSLIPHFLATQGAVQFLNVACGILVLRFLSVPDFAVYVVLTGLQSVGSISGDMGLSQAMNTFSAKAHADKQRVGRLLHAANAIRRRLLLLALVVTAVFAFVMLRNTAGSLLVGVMGFTMVLAAARTQQIITLRTSILNANHDSAALFRSGMSGAIVRLALVLALIPAYPNSLVAFATNFAGILASAAVIRRFSDRYLEGVPGSSEEQRRQLLTFIYPLFPGALYFLLQGQISTMLLSIKGDVAYVAELGALSRLGQIVAFFALLNPFWIQPTFARLTERSEFKRRAAVLLAAIMLGTLVLVVSSFLWPAPWLLILGHQYAHLTGELPLAVFSALIGILGATLFTLVMAIGDMRYQMLHIPLGIGAQCLVLFVRGVNSTHDAILLAAAPLLTYALLQGSILSWKLFRSESSPLNDERK